MGWVLAGCFSVAWAAPIEVDAAASELDVTAQTDYWIDHTGQLDAATVAVLAPSLPFEPSASTLTHRLGDGALWQRLVLQPLPAGQRWFLQVSFHGLDQVGLFYQDADGHWVAQRAGDRVAVDDWAIRDRTPVFALDTAAAPREYWLRIANWPIPVGARLLLLREDELTAWRNGGNLLLGAYFGLALLVVYVGALSARQYADRAFAAYCLYASMATMVQVCFTGIGGLFLWPHSPWWNNAAPFIFSMLSCAAGGLLLREVCSIHRLSPALDRFVLAWVAFGPLWGVAYVAWPSSAGFGVLALYQVACLVLVLTICFWCHRNGERWALRFGLSFLPVLVTAPFPILRNQGLLPASFLTQYALAIGAALEIPLQLWMLSRRAREISEAGIRANAMETQDPLTGLPPRGMLLFRLRDALKRARRDSRRCAMLVINLANHAEILAGHGREAADRALVLAGARLMRVARDVDTVSRIDLAQFAMLMEGPVTSEQAAAMATQVVARGLNPSLKLPGGVTLKFHVTCMLAPDPGLADSDDAESCLMRLSHELARLSPDGRKAIAHLNY
ncbi:sensor domain-containing diguanylate cyclase [Variovorax terrae]|uniref:Diguanylate cyclase n=1 Tax=Variovorax terrae TaxID=2923278 RepID=A0A9X1VXM7_9BURK|nr:7TM diverse intracellular signaling domain-containing protein [Variovorax terrae]MCJ0763877.1 diguanylate cyclase [Variovorax terrae]